MIPIHKIIGRLSNQMFLTAAHYARCKETGEHFFVQDEKYFKKHENEIRQMFSDGITGGDERVSIHVRRGDYVGNPFYVDLGHHKHEDMSDNYYVRAMAMFPNKKFVVFSDDIEWCKNNPIFKDCEFQHGTEVEDMNAMANCEHNIIANSSFSWWGAWLNPNPNKIVVAPARWFSDPNYEQFIGIPQTWIRI